MLYVDVILPIPIKNSFTYHFSETQLDALEIGMRVAVPFGKSKIQTGIVLRIHDQKPNYETKAIHQILEEKAVINKHQLKHWLWLAEYYMCTLGEIVKAALPGAFLLESETLITLRKDTDDNQELLTDEEYLILEALHRQSVLRIGEIQDITGKKNVVKIIQSLLNKGYINIQEEVFEQYIPKQKTYLRLAAGFSTEEKLNTVLEELSAHATKQREVLMHLFLLQAQTKKPIEPKMLLESAKASSGVLKTLVDKGIIERYELQEDRHNFEGDVHAISQLTEAQEAAYNKLQKSFETHSVCLLHGVTSSGKTEVYIRCIEEVLKAGKQILYLVPEIALTTQLIGRLRKHFGPQLSVYHSKYSVHERIEVWNNVQSGKGKAQIIIGARSTIFLPYRNLGLIIIDEEHEASYKQQNPAPRYNARDAAIVLGVQHKAKVLLGSATPSFETYTNSKSGKYGWVELTQRFRNIPMPKINFINLKEAYKRKKIKGRFTDELIEAIKHTLERKQQVILFQNRRGFSPVVECTTCGVSPQCPNCDVSLTYHKYRKQLRCHYCGYAMSMLISCMACGNETLDYKGFGTQQIEQEILAFFPDYRTQRMDQDTTRRKHAYEKIIERMQHQKIDILIGTQMLAKGLDFPNIGLVGVLQADNLLNFPDFRAHERSFQLLQQVAGRAGRGNKQGDVLIQTYNPSQPILKTLRENDYKKMYEMEISERQIFQYPPFVKLIQLTFRDRDYQRMRQAATWYANAMRSQFPTQVLGPEDPSVGRIRNQYLTHIILKIPNEKLLKQSKRHLQLIQNRFSSIKQYRSVRVTIDVDPI